MADHSLQWFLQHYSLSFYSKWGPYSKSLYNQGVEHSSSSYDIGLMLFVLQQQQQAAEATAAEAAETEACEMIEGESVFQIEILKKA